MEAERRKVAADVCSYVDDDGSKLHLEVTLPGVRKEGITVKLLDDSFSIVAERDDLEYVTAGAFCCPVNPGEANAVYDNGLLKIDIPFKDAMADAVTVTIH